MFHSGQYIRPSSGVSSDRDASDAMHDDSSNSKRVIDIR